MKKILLPFAAFIITFFGLFTVINAFVVLIFPITWNDVVTCPGWCVSYFFIGLVCSIAVTDSVISNNS